MGFYDDHVNAVTRRLQAKWNTSKFRLTFTLTQFKRGAAVYLKRYGWNEQEIERILSNIK